MLDHQKLLVAYQNYYAQNGHPYIDQGYNISVARLTDPKWRVLAVHHLTGPENGGNHNVYIEVIDEQGHRIPRQFVKLTWEGKQGPADVLVIDKPSNEPGTNAPLWFQQTVSVWVEDNVSEVVSGIHTRHPDEPGGNQQGHHSFYIVFQRNLHPVTPPPTPTPDPTPEPNPVPDPLTAEKALAEIKTIVDEFYSRQ